MSDTASINDKIDKAMITLSNLAASGANKAFMLTVSRIITRLRHERNTLNAALLEEAAYCEKYEKECTARGELERALRHRERKERLLSKTLK